MRSNTLRDGLFTKFRQAMLDLRLGTRAELGCPGIVFALAILRPSPVLLTRTFTVASDPSDFFRVELTEVHRRPPLVFGDLNGWERWTS